MKAVIGRIKSVRPKAYLLASMAVFFSILVFKSATFAADFSSSNFINRDPVLLSQGGRSTSTNFQLISGTSQNVIGLSTSTNFDYRSGFYYFPLVTTPVLSATAGDGSAQLSWTAAVGSLGFTVSSYQVGVATGVNGPFTYTNVGNVLTATQNSLTNSTAYYFVIRALDIFGFPIVSSSLVTATPTGVTSGGGGGVFGSGGGGSAITTGSVALSGSTAPNQQVTILQNGSTVRTITSDASGNFTTTLANVTAGTVILTLYATDSLGLRTAPSTFLVTVTSGETYVLSNIFLAQTVTSDKEAVSPSDSTVISGTSVPNSVITIFIDGPKNLIINTNTDANGRYSITFPALGFPVGSYQVLVRGRISDTTSNTSRPLGLVVGESSIDRDMSVATCPTIADFNGDCRVDLVDFSILLYWFNVPNPPAQIDLNKDRVANLIDFSVMMYYWTN